MVVHAVGGIDGISRKIDCLRVGTHAGPSCNHCLQLTPASTESQPTERARRHVGDIASAQYGQILAHVARRRLHTASDAA